MVAARWAAVFPIAKLVNVVFRARGQRGEELPQSYQVMMFWAGLRGAVGVALAAGIKGHNAKSLRTTVLVTVVITLVIFGGTVSKMIEIVGIRTGVVEDDDEDSDEEGPMALPRPGESSDLSKYTVRTLTHIAGESIYRDYGNSSVHSLHNGKRYSPTSPHRSSGHEAIDSDDDDPEVLPSASSASFGEEDVNADGAVWRDGQWFNVLDERYLLPVFSNATASRRQASRKAQRSTARLGHYADQNEPDSPERDLTNISPGARSPWENTSGSIGNAAEAANAGPGNGQRSGRGLVQHKQTPSLSAAVSSLFSSIVSSDEASSPGMSGTSGAVESPYSEAGQPEHRNRPSGFRPSQSSSFFPPSNPPSRTSPSRQTAFSSFVYPKRKDSSDGRLPFSPIAENFAEWDETPLAGSHDSLSNATSATSATPSAVQLSDAARQLQPSPTALTLARADSAGAVQRRQSAPQQQQDTNTTRHRNSLSIGEGTRNNRHQSTQGP